MSKAVLISIRPQWCEKIASGEKTIEVRKTRPKMEMPFKCYIYVTNTRPFLVIGDVFRGNWYTEFTHLSGYGRTEADRIWDVFNGGIMGEFVCDRIDVILPANEPYGIYDIDDDYVFQTCLENGALWDYGNGKMLYGWHISNLKIYDTPRELGDFRRACDMKRSTCEACKLFCERKNLCFGDGTMQITRPPQSWGYVEELP